MMLQFRIFETAHTRFSNTMAATMVGTKTPLTGFSCERCFLLILEIIYFAGGGAP